MCPMGNNVIINGKMTSVLKTVVILLALILLAALFLVGWKFTLSPQSFPDVSGRWQGVFLTNNQVYFGHLGNYNNEYVVLKNIYYLRAADSLQQGAVPQGANLNLVKLGAELHGPEDIMYIPRDKILFWENLTSSSQVVQAINNFLSQEGK